MRTKAERWTQRLRDVLAVLAVTSALVTILFGVRSAWLYFAARSVEVLELESWLQVAEDRAAAPVDTFWQKIPQLEEAAFALDQAIMIKPNDRELQRLHFMAMATFAYTGMENLVVDHENWREHLDELTTDGRRISLFVTAPELRAPLLEALARVEIWSGDYNTLDTTLDLLREAVDLAPDDDSLRFQLAKQLLEYRSSADEGMEILHDLVENHPDNPQYLLRLGARLAENGEKESAVEMLERAVQLPNVDESWEFAYAVRQAQSRLFRLLQELIASGETLVATVVDPLAGDLVMDNNFLLAGFDRGIAGLYWWERGLRERALRNLVESGPEFPRGSLPLLLEKELEWFDMGSRDMKPSLAEMKAMQVHENIADQFEHIADDVQSYIASIEEVEFLESERREFPALGAQVQHWPDEGLLLRRVVPGFWLAEAGAQPNDWLYSVNGVELGGIEALRARLEGPLVSATVIRDGESQVLAVSD